MEAAQSLFICIKAANDASRKKCFLLSKIVDDHFYVIMSLYVTTDPCVWRHPSTTYACNDVDGVIISTCLPQRSTDGYCQVPVKFEPK